MSAPSPFRVYDETPDTGVNLMLLHETQPTCVRDGNVALVQLEVDARTSTTWE